MASVVAFAATDIFLPSLPGMAVYFNVSDELAQFALPIFLLGELLAALIWGVISDYLGRKPVILAGMIIFLLGTIICIFSTSIYVFLFGRFVQGVGAIVVPVVGWAAIQDLYPSDESAKIMAWVGGLISVGPMVAPAVGGYIDVNYGWRGSFTLLIIITILYLIAMFIVKFPVAHTATQRPSAIRTFKTYKTILSNPKFLSYVSLFAFLASGEWCYFAMVPFYFEDHLFVSPDHVGLYIALAASAYILGTLISPELLKRRNLDQVLGYGIYSGLIGACLLLIVYWVAPTYPFPITLSIGVYFIGAAMVWTCSVSRALQCFPHNKGAASAVRSIVCVTFFTLGSFAGSLMDDSTILHLAIFILATSLITLAIFKNRHIRSA